MTPIDLPAGITNTVQVDSSAAALAIHGRERNQQLEGYWRRKIQQHYHAQFLQWATLDTSSLESYERSTQPLRAHLLDALGGWESRPSEARARVEYLGD